MTNDMTKGTPWRLILFFSLPLLIGNIFQQLYSMADTIIVGRFVGVDALAAVGATGAIFFLVIGFVQGVTSGFSVVTAQRFGAGDIAGVKKSVGISIVLCIIITVLLTALSIATTYPLLRLMNTPEHIFQDAAVYIIIVYAGIGATMYYNMISGILRALGDSRTPLIFLLVSSVLNIVLDLSFIINFHMGVAGAAFATVISQLVSAVLCTFYTKKRYYILKLKKSDFQWDWKNAKLHLGIGLPMALQFSVTAVGVMVLQGALNRFGAKAIAAYTAASKVEMLVTQPFATLGITMATYCGQNLGASKIDRIKKGVACCVLMCLVSSAVAAAINVFLGKSITMFFLQGVEEEILRYSQTYLNTIAIFYPILGLLYIYRNSLQGMGEAFIPMMGGLGELLARLIVATTLPVHIGYMGVCLASPAAWIAATIPLVTKFYLMMHKHKKTALSEMPSQKT